MAAKSCPYLSCPDLFCTTQCGSTQCCPSYLGVVGVRCRHLKCAHAVLDAPEVAVGAKHHALAQQRSHDSLARNHHARLAVWQHGAGNAAHRHVACLRHRAPEADACREHQAHDCNHAVTAAMTPLQQTQVGCCQTIVATQVALELAHKVIASRLEAMCRVDPALGPQDILLLYDRYQQPAASGVFGKTEGIDACELSMNPCCKTPTRGLPDACVPKRVGDKPAADGNCNDLVIRLAVACNSGRGPARACDS